MERLDNLFQRALEISPNPTFLLNRQGLVILWNRACEDFTGVTAAEVLDSDRHRQVFYPSTSPPRPTLADILLNGEQADLTNLYAADQKPLEVGENIQAEGWFPNLGGKDRYITFIAARVFDSEGEFIAVIETFHDITERRQDEEKMDALFAQVCEGKRQWEETMDCIDDLVMVVDDENKIRRYNRSIEKMLGLSFREILQAEWRNLLQRGGVTFNPAGGSENECHFAQTDRWFLLKEYAFQSAESGSGTWTVVTLHDRTKSRHMTLALERAHAELKATQGQILQSEKMASIGQLAAGVAHEINNPIGFVKSNLNSFGKYIDQLTTFIAKQEQLITELAKETAPTMIAQLRKDSKVDFILEDIRDLQMESLEGIERVRNIVQDLKSFSRVDQAEFSSVDLNACLESTLNIVINELKYKATIEKDLAPLPLIPCYPQQLNQVFLNLLVNAGHAIEEQGTIGIRSWRDKDLVCIAVSDTGCGIPEANLSHLFEPFFTTKEVGKGTGLGLSISYDIIKKHGGTLLVDSQVGIGTTFTIQLPRQQDKKQEG